MGNASSWTDFGGGDPNYLPMAGKVSSDVGQGLEWIGGSVPEENHAPCDTFHSSPGGYDSPQQFWSDIGGAGAQTPGAGTQGI